MFNRKSKQKTEQQDHHKKKDPILQFRIGDEEAFEPTISNIPQHIAIPVIILVSLIALRRIQKENSGNQDHINNPRTLSSERGGLLSVFKRKLSPEKVQSVRLIQQNLSSLPLRLIECTKLTVLDISHNQLTMIPESLSSLICLQQLYAQGNNIQSIENGSLVQADLKYINLESNSLSEFPEQLFNLPSLRSLLLGHNQLANIPNSITQFQCLLELQINHNQLAQLPSTLPQLSTLMKFNIECNNITYFPQQFTQKMTALEALLLQGNPLSTITIESLRNLKRLSWCSLSQDPKIMAMNESDIEQKLIPEKELPSSLTPCLCSPGQTHQCTNGTCKQTKMHGLKACVRRLKYSGSSQEISIMNSLNGGFFPLLQQACLDPATVISTPALGTPIAARENYSTINRCIFDSRLHLSVQQTIECAKDICGTLLELHNHNIFHGGVDGANMAFTLNGDQLMLYSYQNSFKYPDNQKSLWQAADCRAFGVFVAQLTMLVPQQARQDRQSALLFEELLELLPSITAAEPKERISFREAFSKFQLLQMLA